MGSCRNSKRPSLSDVTLYESPVATLTALILAPVTTAPEGSTTVPRILAYRLSAFAGVVQASPITKPTARSATLKRNACCFMKDPPTRILLTEADTERPARSTARDRTTRRHIKQLTFQNSPNITWLVIMDIETNCIVLLRAYTCLYGNSYEIW